MSEQQQDKGHNSGSMLQQIRTILHQYHSKRGDIDRRFDAENPTWGYHASIDIEALEEIQAVLGMAYDPKPYITSPDKDDLDAIKIIEAAKNQMFDDESVILDERTFNNRKIIARVLKNAQSYLLDRAEYKRPPLGKGRMQESLLTARWSMLAQGITEWRIDYFNRAKPDPKYPYPHPKY